MSNWLQISFKSHIWGQFTQHIAPADPPGPSHFSQDLLRQRKLVFPWAVLYFCCIWVCRLMWAELTAQWSGTPRRAVKERRERVGNIVWTYVFIHLLFQNTFQMILSSSMGIRPPDPQCDPRVGETEGRAAVVEDVNKSFYALLICNNIV